MISYATIALKTLQERYPLLPELPQYHHKWSYDIGVTLQGVKLAYQQTGDPKLLQYIQRTMDEYIDAAGHILNYSSEPMNSDFINNGKLLLFLFKTTHEDKYRLAADQLYEQIQKMPRTPEGGFWHKKIYHQQMWLDGLYMVEPFYAQYCILFNHSDKIADIVHQFKLIYQKTFDRETGLLVHAWNADHQEPWANQFGQSPHVWGRAMGWYCLALVDTYELLIAAHPKAAQELLEIYSPLMAAVQRAQDRATQTWYQVLDQPRRRGNYLEASASSMFVYAYAKGIRLGMLTDHEWLDNAKAAYQGLLDQFVFLTKQNWLNLVRNCQVAGLGGAEQRDGSFVYYISEPIITNDFKGYGAFLQAALEMEALLKNQK